MPIASDVQDARGLAHLQREAFVISTQTIEGRSIVLSRYADSQWHLVGQPTNRSPAHQILNFEAISPA